MSATEDIETVLPRLKRSRFGNVPFHCGVDEDPGIDEIPDWRVWTNHATTPDQARIEIPLAKIVKPDSKILHIGVGNSSLAKNFCPIGATVLGTTIHQEEKKAAEALNIQGYSVIIANKYSSKEMGVIKECFDFIVDNNPSSFSCCLFHFCSMILSYKRLLRGGGSILSAEPGMSWVITHGNPNWALNSNDWALLAETFDFSAKRVDKFVYSLKQPSESRCFGGLRKLARRLATRQFRYYCAGRRHARLLGVKQVIGW